MSQETGPHQIPKLSKPWFWTSHCRTNFCHLPATWFMVLCYSSPNTLGIASVFTNWCDAAWVFSTVFDSSGPSAMPALQRYSTHPLSKFVNHVPSSQASWLGFSYNLEPHSISGKHSHNNLGLAERFLLLANITWSTRNVLRLPFKKPALKLLTDLSLWELSGRKKPSQTCSQERDYQKDENNMEQHRFPMNITQAD
jgi:hypothetical protein